MSNTDDKILIDAKGAAAMLSIAKSTFWAWVASGLMPQPCIRRGKIVRWRVADIRQAAEKMANQPDPEPEAVAG